MKKVLIVLVLGMTMFSCSKEEVPTVEEQEDCFMLITGLRYDYMGCDCYEVLTTNQEMGEDVFLVDKSTYDYYRNQYTNDLSMCFDGFH